MNYEYCIVRAQTCEALPLLHLRRSSNVTYYAILLEIYEDGKPFQLDHIRFLVSIPLTHSLIVSLMDDDLFVDYTIYGFFPKFKLNKLKSCQFFLNAFDSQLIH